MKDYSQQTIGEIVESLIRIKDYYIDNRDDLETINNACNILTHNFKRTHTVESLEAIREEAIVSIHWVKEDIKGVLKEEGFEPSNENIEILLNNNPKFKEYIVEQSVEIGFEIIANEIYECSDKLKPIISPKEE